LCARNFLVGGADGRYSEVRGAHDIVAGCPREGGEFAVGGVEADLESFDFAEPAVDAGFGDAVGEVLDDADEAASGGGVGAEHGAADAGVLVGAGGSVGAPAGAELELALLEVLLELAPFIGGRLPVFGFGADGPALVEVGAVGACPRG
jgi:hypothetical protein